MDGRFGKVGKFRPGTWEAGGIRRAWDGGTRRRDISAQVLSGAPHKNAGLANSRVFDISKTTAACKLFKYLVLGQSVLCA